MTIEELSLGAGIALDLIENPVVVNVDAYDIEGIADRSTIKYELDVYVHTGDAYELFANLEADEEPADTYGGLSVYRGAFWEISDILKGYISDRNQVKIQENTVFEIPELTFRYYTITRVKVNDVLEETVTNSERWAFYGGISEVDFEKYGAVFFSDYIASEGRFLSVPVPEVEPGSVHLLSWLHNYSNTISSLRLKIVGKYASGGEAQYLGAMYDEVRPMSVYAIPINLKVSDGLILSTLPVEELETLTMWLLDGEDNRISETVTCYVKDVVRLKPKQMVYMNSLNVPVGLWFQDTSIEKIELNRTLGQTYRGFGFETRLYEIKVEKVESRRRWLLGMELAETWMSKLLTEVSFTREAYLYDKGNWLPLVPVWKDWLVDNGTEDPVGIVMEMELGYTETKWSELPEKETTESRQTGWRPFSSACQLDSRGRYNGMLEVIRLERYYIDDNSAVKPTEIKRNKSGEDGYVPPIASAACTMMNTPFLSAAYSKTGSYNRIGCPVDQIGGPATINIAQYAWGSLINQGNANNKAKAEADALDTQAYANLNGTCNTIGVYNPGTIPAGRWWLRVGGFTGLSGIAANYDAYRPGNMWFQYPEYQANQTDVNLSPRFDVDFPALSGGRVYYFNAYELGGKTLRFWKNGVLQSSVPITQYHQVVQFPSNPVSQDKWWIDVI